MSESSVGEPALLNTLKRVATGLKRAGVAFALGGGYAVYARGGPKSEHDVDFVLREDDVERALDVLAQEGLRPVRPPEDWLVKVYDRDRIVDLIYRLNGRPVDQFLDRADEMEVGSVQMPVLSATALVVSRLRALTEHNCDFGAVLPMVRALREQVDWDAVRRDTEDSAYAQAFLVLGERLRLIAPVGGREGGTVGGREGGTVGGREGGTAGGTGGGSDEGDAPGGGNGGRDAGGRRAAHHRPRPQEVMR